MRPNGECSPLDFVHTVSNPDTAYIRSQFNLDNIATMLNLADRDLVELYLETRLFLARSM